MGIRQLTLTIRNCIKLRTFRHFNVLYDHVNFPVNRHKENPHQSSGFIEWKAKPFKFVQISIEKGMKGLELDTTLLHEIGHAIDFRKKIHLGNKYRVHSNSNSKINEKNAWKESLKLSEEYNTPLCYDSAIKWLSTYNTQYRRLENLASNKQ